MADEPRPVITLTTDFGTKDHYVGSMKGVIKEINPEVDIIDITHDINPFDIIGAGLTIAAAAPAFPRWTVHIVVVDPGVGSNRRALLVAGDKDYFIGPDNGIFSMVLEQQEFYKIYEITAEHLYRPSAIATFHGRDVFAPVAAWITRGVDTSHMGELIEDPVRIPLPQPISTGEGTYRGVVLHSDNFGNIITNFKQNFLQSILGADLTKKCVLIIGDQRIPGLMKSYHEVERGRPVSYVGSYGYLEIAVNQGAAATLFKARRGLPVTLIVQP